MSDSNGSECPDAETLSRYATGRVASEADQEITNHLEECRSCEETVDAMAGSDDTLMNVLRQLPPIGEPFDDEIAEPQLERGLRELTEPDVEETMAEPSVSIDSGVTARINPSQESNHLDRPAELGQYRLVRKLGQGGMGAVYEAIHTRLDKRVALKVMAGGRIENKQAVERFNREMKAIGRVQHPNVVVAHDGGQVGDEHFLVMEYVDGADVSELDSMYNGLPVRVACEIVRQAAIGIQHAHDMGLVHRDIKPSNLMLSQNGMVKVLDLGLARIDSLAHENDAKSSGTELESLTTSGVAMGSLGYMSPEQVLDSHSVDHRADLYSLGVALFRLLTRTLPFPSDRFDTNGKMLVAIATHQAPSISGLRPDLPPKLIQIVDELLAKEPSDRIATADEVARRLLPFAGVDLAGVCTGTLPQAASAETTQSRTPSFTRMKSGVLAITSLAFFGFLYFAAQMFLVTTEHGTLVVEVIDDEVEAKLKSSGLSVFDKRNNKVWEVNTRNIGSKKLDEGEYRFEAPSGLVVTDEQGLEIDANEFKLLDANKQLRLRISLKLTPDSPAPMKSYASGQNNGPAPAIVPFDSQQAQEYQESWAEHLGIDVETTNSLGMKFRVIPPGEFVMGTSQKEMDWIQDEVAGQSGDPKWYRKHVLQEMPQHHVTLTQPFLLCKYEVTRGQFRAFVEATGYKTDAEKDDLGGQGRKNGEQPDYSLQFSWNTNVGFDTKQTENDPVINVSWNDATAFCQWLSQKEGINYRLATEAEWEFACRAGSQARYGPGDDPNELRQYGWFLGNGYRTHPVGQKQPNAFGLYDLHGNVFEWCSDIAAPYKDGPVIDPAGAKNGDGRSNRGGSFVIHPMHSRSSERLSFGPTARNENLGFRVARDVRPQHKSANSENGVLNELKRDGERGNGVGTHLPSRSQNEPLDDRSDSITLDEILTPEQAQPQLNRLVDRYGGNVVATDRYGTILQGKEQTYSPDTRCLDISLSDCAGFDDEAFRVLSRLLRILHHPKLRLKLDMSGTAISDTGVLALSDVTIDTLNTDGTDVSPAKIGDRLISLRIVNWWLDDNVRSDQDLLASLKVPTIRSIRVRISGRVPSADAVEKLSEGPLERIQLMATRGDDSQLGADRLQALATCKQLHELKLTSFDDLDRSKMDFLGDRLPATRVTSDHGVRGRDAEYTRDRVTTNDGIEFSSADFVALVDAAESVPAQYDLEFNARRTSLWADGLGVSVPIAKTCAIVIFGGFDGDASFIEEVNGEGPFDNGTSTPVDPFADGQMHRFEIRVRNNSLTARVDGETLIDWTGAPEIKPTFINDAKRSQVVLVSYLTASFHVSNVKVTPVNPQP